MFVLVFLQSQIQSMVRMHQARKKYRDRLKYFKDHVSNCLLSLYLVMIQSICYLFALYG